MTSCRRVRISRGGEVAVNLSEVVNSGGVVNNYVNG